MNGKEGGRLPPAFPCVRKAGTIDYKYNSYGLATLPIVPLKKGETYATQEIVDHIKILPKRSKERAAAISTVIESGNAKIGRTKIYECLNEAERDAAWVADAETIAKSKEPADVMNLGIQYEGSHINAGLHDKDLKWRGSIVLNLRQVRFCDNLSECRREYKFVSSKSYVEQDVDPSLHHIVKRVVLGSDDEGRLPIDICQLLGNSDIVQRIPEGATSEDLHKMWLSSADPAFDELRKRYNLPRLHWFTERFSIQELRIRKLYFSEWEYPPPSKVESEQGNKIIWNRLKSYIEYMANLGGSPVVCAGGRSKCVKKFKCKASYQKRKGEGESKPCTFNFTVKWDEHGYYINLLSDSRQYCNNGCAWHSCAEKK